MATHHFLSAFTHPAIHALPLTALRTFLHLRGVDPMRHNKASLLQMAARVCSGEASQHVNTFASLAHETLARIGLAALREEDSESGDSAKAVSEYERALNRRAASIQATTAAADKEEGAGDEMEEDNDDDGSGIDNNSKNVGNNGEGDTSSINAGSVAQALCAASCGAMAPIAMPAR